MNVYARMELDSPGRNNWERALTFFGHLDCRVYMRPEAYIDVGAGSLPNLGGVDLILDGHRGPIGRIGRYCEFARCTIMSGGEHENDHPVNVSFSGAPVFGKLTAQRSGLKPTPLIDIGHAVVISRDAKVLPGVSVGDGAVIGAGAVVTKPAEAFGIYAGVPARKLRDRMTPPEIEAVQRVAWWNFAPGYLAANLDGVQALAVSEGHHLYDVREIRMVMTMVGGAAKIAVLGVQTAEGFRPIADCQPRLQAYVAQAFGPGPYEWLADPFAA